MFGQVQRKLLTNRVISHSPKWVSCDGIDLADPTVKRSRSGRGIVRSYRQTRQNRLLVRPNAARHRVAKEAARDRKQVLQPS